MTNACLLTRGLHERARTIGLSNPDSSLAANIGSLLLTADIRHGKMATRYVALGSYTIRLISRNLQDKLLCAINFDSENA